MEITNTLRSFNLTPKNDFMFEMKEVDKILQKNKISTLISNF
jgi:hypothetical protein